MRLYFPICQATGRERTKVNFLIYSNSIYFSSFKYLIILRCFSHSLPFQYIFIILVYINIVVTMKEDIYDVDFPCKRLKVIIEQIVTDIVLRWKSQKIDKEEIDKNLGNRRRRAYELLEKCRSNNITAEVIEEKFKWAYKELKLDYPFSEQP